MAKAISRYPCLGLLPMSYGYTYRVDHTEHCISAEETYVLSNSPPASRSNMIALIANSLRSTSSAHSSVFRLLPFTGVVASPRAALFNFSGILAPPFFDSDTSFGSGDCRPASSAVLSWGTPFFTAAFCAVVVPFGAAPAAVRVTFSLPTFLPPLLGEAAAMRVNAGADCLEPCVRGSLRLDLARQTWGAL